MSALICRDEGESRRQFVLINNTRTLPKSLIYELLPSVNELATRLCKRADAADLTATLNFRSTSKFYHLIKMQTWSTGVIADTIIQKIIVESLSDGVMRTLIRQKSGVDLCVRLLFDFFEAVDRVFPGEWEGQSPVSSRLRHGAGTLAMGAVMEFLAEDAGARTAEEFEAGSKCLRGKTAWTSGEWNFDGEVRKWNSIQNFNRDIALLKHYLTSIVKADLRSKRRARSFPLKGVAE